jgi:hypothetical protein
MIVLAVLAGVALGAAGGGVWFAWAFKDMWWGQ